MSDNIGGDHDEKSRIDQQTPEKGIGNWRQIRNREKFEESRILISGVKVIGKDQIEVADQNSRNNSHNRTRKTTASPENRPEK